MARRRSYQPRDPGRTRTNLIFAGAAILLVLVLCVSASASSLVWFVRLFSGGDDSQQAQTPSWSADSAELTVAVSPLMAPVLQELATQFNSLDRRTEDDSKMVVWIVPLVPERMVEMALDLPNFQAVSPDSNLWIDEIEQRWSQVQGETDEANQIPIGVRRTSGHSRYAVSPIVIAAWEDVARQLGWPNAVGWQDIQRLATQDPNFKWNHPSTNNASGLLATLAEFYAGANLTRGLTAEAATAQSTLDYVQAVESTVRFYGEGEEVIIERLAQEGKNFLDAFVAQEQVVIDWNRRYPDKRLVAIYPAEGTLWTDHPLALLELGLRPHELAVTANQRETYNAFSSFLSSPESQRFFLDSGYRPADLSIALDTPGSPFADADAVDWRQPQTTLQMPSPSVIEVVRNVWYYTKRPTNVYLVVDTSGSMEGEKIARARTALAAFIQQIRGDRDQLGIVEFGSGVKRHIPLHPLDDASREDVLAVVDSMEARGGTALIDAVRDAVLYLQSNADDQAINAIVVMTDGQENESNYRLSDIEALLQRSPNRLVIFTIAFGSDADEPLLRSLAGIGQGQFRRADETSIEELYRIISTYF
jgi:Ca-activated chloride channel family protein